MKSFSKWELLALLLCALIGVLSIPFPFHGDQAMFMMAVKKLHTSGVLYRDFWDFKQPGIYWFFLTGGTLFGFTEIGVHALECIYMLIASAAILVSLRGRLIYQWIAPCSAVLFSIWYYGVATDWHRTQVEALAGLPLLISLAIFSSSQEKPGTLWAGALAGTCSAAALILKFAFLPLVAGQIVIYLVIRWRTKQRIPSPLLLGYVAALLVVLGSTALYYSASGAGHLAFDANFLYPGHLIRTYPPASHFTRFRGSLLWFLKSFLPLIGLAAAGFFLPRTKRDSLFLFQLCYWLVMGLFVIWVQFYSHWGYHFFLLFVPVLLLASMALDQLCSKLTFNTPAVVGFLVLISIIPIWTIVRRSALLAENGFALSPAGKTTYYSALSTNEYRSVSHDAAFLNAPNSLQGPILVIGNPLYYTVSGRTQAGAENGWAPDLMLATNRQRMVSDLTRQPATYVLIDGEFETGIVKERFGDLLNLLHDRYEVIQSGPYKTWYRLRTAAPKQSPAQ